MKIENENEYIFKELLTLLDTNVMLKKIEKTKECSNELNEFLLRLSSIQTMEITQFIYNDVTSLSLVVTLLFDIIFDASKISRDDFISLIEKKTKDFGITDSNLLKVIFDSANTMTNNKTFAPTDYIFSIENIDEVFEILALILKTLYQFEDLDLPEKLPEGFEEFSQADFTNPFGFSKK